MNFFKKWPSMGRLDGRLAKTLPWSLDLPMLLPKESSNLGLMVIFYSLLIFLFSGNCGKEKDVLQHACENPAEEQG